MHQGAKPNSWETNEMTRTGYRSVKGFFGMVGRNGDRCVGAAKRQCRSAMAQRAFSAVAAMPSRPSILALIAALAFGIASPALAQSNDETAADAAPSLLIELNTFSQVESACRLIFMATNTLGQDLSSVSFETVLIDQEGTVDRLTVFDFQDLPDDRPRVRQFDLANTDCEAIGTILINGFASCEGDGVTEAACIEGLIVSSKSDVEISG